MEFHAPVVDQDSVVLAQMRIPVSKSGSMKELQTVFKGLQIPMDVKADGEWISTTTAKDSVLIVSRNIKEGLVPNVVGMGLQDALYLLENSGMKVKVSGYGTVKRQSVPAGQPVRSNPYITIELL
jgi:cell division protein FtsI (penicillin-binding protein 3)